MPQCQAQGRGTSELSLHSCVGVGGSCSAWGRQFMGDPFCRAKRLQYHGFQTLSLIAVLLSPATHP